MYQKFLPAARARSSMDGLTRFAEGDELFTFLGTFVNEGGTVTHFIAHDAADL